MIENKTIWHAFYQAIAALRIYVVWVPLTSYLVIKIGVILLYLGTIRGPMSDVWALLLEPRLRQAIPHYPGTIVLMPVILSRVDIFFDIFISLIFQGATIVLFTEVMRQGQPGLRGAITRTWQHYGALIAVSLVATGLMYVWFELPAWLGIVDAVPGTILIGGLILGGLLLQALFIYAMPLIILQDASPVQALRLSMSECFHTFTRTFLLVLLPFVMTLPVLYLNLNAPALVARLTPEIMIHITIAQELSQWLSMLLMLGALSAFFVRRKSI